MFQRLVCKLRLLKLRYFFDRFERLFLAVVLLASTWHSLLCIVCKNPFYFVRNSIQLGYEPAPCCCQKRPNAALISSRPSHGITVSCKIVYKLFSDISYNFTFSSVKIFLCTISMFSGTMAGFERPERSVAWEAVKLCFKVANPK